MSYPVESISQHELHDLDNFGFNPQWEAERRLRLINRFGMVGEELADFEHQQNLSLYQSEFIDDAPISPAFVYAVVNGKFSTQLVDDQLFRIESGINPNERSGKTLQGFNKFCELQQADPGKVAVWYSPAGEDIGCDTGRLYLGFINSDGLTINLNIKVLEEKFPILQTLNSLSGQEEATLFNYLTQPVGTTMTITELIDWFKNNPYTQSVIYQSHRLAEDPRPKVSYRINDIADLINRAVTSEKIISQIRQLNYFKDKFDNFVYQPAGDMTAAVIERITRQMRANYYGLIQSATYQEQTFLYGCSATGKKPGSLSTIDDINSQNPLTIFDSVIRIPGLTSEDNSHKDRMKCVTCPFCNHTVDAIVEESSDKKTITCPDCHRSVTVNQSVFSVN